MSLERHLGQLFLTWFNQRRGRDFGLLPETDPAASDRPAESQLWVGDGHYRLALAVDRLYESQDAAWERRRLEVEDRLTRALHAPYLLWMPPQARLPGEEPEESEFALRVQMGAAPLLAGGCGEVSLSVPLRLGKTQDNGVRTPGNPGSGHNDSSAAIVVVVLPMWYGAHRPPCKASGNTMSEMTAHERVGCMYQHREADAGAALPPHRMRDGSSCER